ncbi:MAG: pyruvate dehydrogenase complex dihydrolipoamide acetyltransferase [Chlamydiia bacterium]|nr:pyruvate dehydrogenase complex dihydrolipoamide acetyltransferase [Chlamydiia bacterium]
MPFTFTMPKLSPTMEEGVIAKWCKKVGDFVNEGDVLLEVLTDKATVEHTAIDEGYLRKILVPEGEFAKLNQPIAIFSATENENIENYILEKDIEVEVSGSESEKKEEDFQSTHTPQPVMTTTMPTFAPEPPLASYRYQPHREGTFASPLAKKIAKEKRLDLKSVKGSGPGGRIVLRDLERALPERLVTFGDEAPPQIVPGTYDVIIPSPMRKVIAQRLQESKSSIPHYYLTKRVNATPMVELRSQLKSLEHLITFNDMVIRGCALALRKHPEMNRGYNSVDQTIIAFKTIDISVAVSFKDGLITPIIRHADYKNIREISIEIKELAKRASKGKLKEEEYKGGSFCISNLGMYGVDEFLAVINPPQAAILAVGKIKETPMVSEGKVVVGKQLTLTLSADHRVIDGTPAAEFLQTLQLLLENPATLVM